MVDIYVYHKVTAEPRQWQVVADQLMATGDDRIKAANGLLYGIWRSQIGMPRDQLTALTVWPNNKAAAQASGALLRDVRHIRDGEAENFLPTLRPEKAIPPRRRGIYTFRWFDTPNRNWEEFLDLCAAAWPGWEPAYDSEVIGLWRRYPDDGKMVRSLLLARRPSLATWERTKNPRTKDEIDVRKKMGRRYDLCDWTCVYTTTLLTAEDPSDNDPWP
jgi:hypothetical protein